MLFVLQFLLHRLSAMLSCVMSGFATPGVLPGSGYSSGGPVLVPLGCVGCVGCAGGTGVEDPPASDNSVGGECDSTTTSAVD